MAPARMPDRDRPPTSALEAQFASLTREFVASLVEALRNASLADVAALSRSGVTHERPTVAAAPATARREPRDEGRAPRKSAAQRAELGEELTRVLADAERPMGVRALAEALGVQPATLAAPLKEMRAAGKIRKHGEKRATTYSLA